jgi:hypothetical protein
MDGMNLFIEAWKAFAAAAIARGESAESASCVADDLVERMVKSEALNAIVTRIQEE